MYYRSKNDWYTCIMGVNNDWRIVGVNNDWYTCIIGVNNDWHTCIIGVKMIDIHEL